MYQWLLTVAVETPLFSLQIPESCKRRICTSGTIKQNSVLRTAKQVQEFVMDTYVRPSKRILFECALLVAISYIEWLVSLSPLLRPHSLDRSSVGHTNAEAPS